jgi:hypothetical protein
VAGVLSVIVLLFVQVLSTSSTSSCCRAGDYQHDGR